MPGAAAPLTDVGAVYPHPFEGGRIGEHLRKDLPVGGLDLAAFAQLAMGLCHPRRQVIAHHLEPTEVEDARGAEARRAAGSCDRESREGLSHELGELPLEMGDLAPQLGAGEAVAFSDPDLDTDVTIEQIGHAHRV